MDHAAWRAVLGDDFVVPVVDPTGAAAALTLRLAAVSDQRVDGGYASYSLEFTGPATMPLEQGTISLRHPGHEEQALFVVPIGEAADLRTYHCVISQAAA